MKLDRAGWLAPSQPNLVGGSGRASRSPADDPPAFNGQQVAIRSIGLLSGSEKPNKTEH